MSTDRRSASERVRERLHEMADAKPHGWKTLVAERLRVANATVTPWFDGSREPSLDQLEKICDLAGIRLAEIVSPEGSLYELDADEGAIVRALRLWPATVRRSLAAFVRYFSNEEPVAGQSRKMAELWRHLPPERRSSVYGYALAMSEGAIPPDIAAEFFDQLSAEAKAAVGRRRTRRRRRADGT
jgi:transcriptional regulator with XRE-family HTH domain